MKVLKVLNSNSENPYLIWNNGTRAELLEFLEHQQEGNIKRVGGHRHSDTDTQPGYISTLLLLFHQIF